MTVLRKKKNERIGNNTCTQRSSGVMPFLSGKYLAPLIKRICAVSLWPWLSKRRKRVNTEVMLYYELSFITPNKHSQQKIRRKLILHNKKLRRNTKQKILQHLHALPLAFQVPIEAQWKIRYGPFMQPESSSSFRNEPSLLIIPMTQHVFPH